MDPLSLPLSSSEEEPMTIFWSKISTLPPKKSNCVPSGAKINFGLTNVGEGEGFSEAGEEGSDVGELVGDFDGTAVGVKDGSEVGESVGDKDGTAVGVKDGSEVGVKVVDEDGTTVGVKDDSGVGDGGVDEDGTDVGVTEDVLELLEIRTSLSLHRK